MKKLLVLAGLLALAFLPVAPLDLSSPQAAEAVTASGVLGLLPPNNDFTAPPQVVTAPTNHDFDDGLTGWTIDGDSNNVSIKTAAGHGNYVQIVGNANLTPKLDSSEITVSSGQSLTFWTYGNGIYLYTGVSPYTGWTLRWAGGGPGWNRHVVVFNFSGTIKLRWRTSGTAGIDEPAITNEAPNWTTSGEVSQVTRDWPAVDDPSEGDDAPYCIGSGAPAAPAGPGVKLDQNASATSAPWTIPANLPVIPIDFVGSGLGPAATITIYHGTNYADSTVLYNNQLDQGTHAVSTFCIVPDLAGENVKIKIASSFGGTIFARTVGFPFASGAADDQAESDDPVAYHSGALSHQHTDLQIPDKGMPLGFTRYYSSYRSGLSDAALGERWFHNYESSLLVFTSGDVLARYPDGGNVFFDLDDDVYVPLSGVNDTLVLNEDDTYTLTTAGQVSLNYDEDGRFTSIVDRNGNTTTLAYNTLGQLETVTGPGGHELTFAYEPGAEAINTPSPSLLFTNSDFESGNYTNWTAGGTAFGTSPTTVSTSGRQGSYFGSSYYGSGTTGNDSLTGTLDSTTFTAGNQLVFKLNGGTSSTVYAGLVQADTSEVLKTSNDSNTNTLQYVTLDTSAYEDDTMSMRVSDSNTGSWGHVGVDYVQRLSDAAGTYTPTQNSAISPFYNSDFEQQTWANWFPSGSAFNRRPNSDDPGNRQGSYYLNSRVNGDSATGTITSAPFTAGTSLSVRIGSGSTSSSLYVALVLDDTSEVLATTGPGVGSLQRVTIDTREYAGQTVRFRLVDNLTSSGGYIRADEILVTYTSRLVSVSDELARTVTFSYNNDTNDLVAVEDVKGGTTEYTYENGRLTTITDSLDQLQVTNLYDSAGRAVEQTDAMGGVTCFYYGTDPAYTSTNCPGVSPEPDPGMTVEVDQVGNKTAFYYDDHYRTTDIEDDLGGVTHYDYDGASNRTCVTDPLDHRTGSTYDQNGNVTAVIDANNTDSGCDLKQYGVQTTFTYTDLNDVETTTDPLGRETEYVYDSSGNLTRVVRMDDLSTVLALTCYERDAAGFVTAVVQSTDLEVPAGATDQCTGNRTLAGYDEFGNPVCSVNARFSNTTDDCDEIATKSNSTYDEGGRLLTMTNEPRQPVSTPESGANCGTFGTGDGDDDDSDTVADDGCPSAIYTYDAQNNVTSATDAEGNLTTFTYDAKSQRTKVTDANRATVGTPESGANCGTGGTGNGADNDSDTVVDDGCPNSISVYNASGQLTKVTDARGNSTTYGYNDAGTRRSVTKANRQAVSTAESGASCGGAGTGDGDDDDSDTVIDDGCPSTIYTYDELNRLEAETDALGRVTAYTYYDDSTLETRTDANGIEAVYTYDDAHQLEEVEYLDSETPVDSVTYDYNDVGSRIEMVDSTGTTTYAYDDLNRVLSVTSPGPSVVEYAYDTTGGVGEDPAEFPGQRTVITYPDSKEVVYTFEPDGRMATVTDWDDRATTYSYDDAGRLETATLPNGVTTSYEYDSAGRLSNLENENGSGTISEYAYTLDGVGNRTQVVDTNGTTTAGYDAGYQVTDVTYPNDDEQGFSYDPMGNRLSMSLTGESTVTYEYDAADQLTEVGGVSYGYDDNGNQTSRGSDAFEFDHQNRLVATNIDSVEGAYAYNGDGLRTNRTIDATSVDYAWDQAAALPQVLQDSDGNTYVYGLDLISVTDGGDDTVFFLCDGLGSTTGLTDEAGDPVADYQYDVFGAVRNHTGTSTEFTYTGEQNDTTALEYLRARYYDPATGRFLSRDPIPFLQRYAYVSNNPSNSIDPLGLCGLTDPWNCGDEMVDIGADVVGGGKDRIDDGLRQGGFLFDFITGTGDAYRYYGQTSAEVADLRRSAGAQVIRDAFVANGCRSTSNIFYDTRPAFRDTVFNPTSTAFQVGGFAGASAVKEGNGMLRITVSNVAGANSLLYHIVPNAPWSTGPLRTIHQTFEWREAVPAACQG